MAKLIYILFAVYLIQFSDCQVDYGDYGENPETARQPHHHAEKHFNFHHSSKVGEKEIHKSGELHFGPEGVSHSKHTFVTKPNHHQGSGALHHQAFHGGSKTEFHQIVHEQPKPLYHHEANGGAKQEYHQTNEGFKQEYNQKDNAGLNHEFHHINSGGQHAEYHQAVDEHPRTEFNQETYHSPRSHIHDSHSHYESGHGGHGKPHHFSTHGHHGASHHHHHGHKQNKFHSHKAFDTYDGHHKFRRNDEDEDELTHSEDVDVRDHFHIDPQTLTDELHEIN